MDIKEETRALNQIPIQTVALWLGVKLPARGSARCPFSDHDDANPSFEVKASGIYWACYGCDRRGGSIDFVKFFNGVGFSEAKRWLAGQVGTTSSRLKVEVRSQKMVTTGTKPSTSAESLPDYELYEAVLGLSPLQSTGAKYLASRYISASTISAFKIGQVTRKNAALIKLLKTYGYERLNNSGLLSKKSTENEPRYLFQEGSILFPFFEKDRAAYLQARVIGQVQNGPKWQNLNNRPRRIYNTNALFGEKSVPIAICEGIMDALSAIDLGYSAIGLIGVSAKITALQMKMLQGREVNILLDWDAPGEKKAFELQREMSQVGIASTRKMRPMANIKDLNEYLIKLKGMG